jgi:hypothetical protein
MDLILPLIFFGFILALLAQLPWPILIATVIVLIAIGVKK